MCLILCAHNSSLVLIRLHKKTDLKLANGTKDRKVHAEISFDLGKNGGHTPMV